MMSTNQDIRPEDFVYTLRSVTEDAALAAYGWIGRGKKEAGDGAAVDAMRSALNKLPINGEIIIGEGEKDEAPMLFHGEKVGSKKGGTAYSIAVDPVEGTSYLAKGLTNAMAVIALTKKGDMFDPTPSFYMEKFAAQAEAKDLIDMSWPTAKKLKALAKALNKPTQELTVFVLEKPRHRKLVNEIYDAGARVALYPAGDVAGAIMAALPNTGIDALMGTGGSPEAIISATAISAIGGVFNARINPQLPSEQIAVKDAGLNTTHWYDVDELIGGDEAHFCATGITTGLLFDGVERCDHYDRVETLLISKSTKGRQVLTTYIPKKLNNKKGKGNA